MAEPEPSATPMSSTLGQMAVAVLKYFDIPAGASDIAAGGASNALYTDAKGWVNAAAQEVADFAPWPWLQRSFQEITVEAGEYTAALPDDLQRLTTDPSYEDYPVLMEPISMQQLQQLRAASTLPGIPRAVAIAYDEEAGTKMLVLWPAAQVERTLTISYIRYLPMMEDDDETPACPPNLWRVIQIGAIAHAEAMHERLWDGPARKQFEIEKARAWQAAGAAGGADGVPLRRHRRYLRSGDVTRRTLNIEATGQL